jgi:hypothetical protein
MPKETFFNLNEEKQENVMRASINEFSKQGFEKGNIGDIAKAAGVSRAACISTLKIKENCFYIPLSGLLKWYQKNIKNI